MAYIPPAKRGRPLIKKEGSNYPETSSMAENMPPKITELINFWEIHNGSVKPKHENLDLHFYMMCGWEKSGPRNPERQKKNFLHHVHLMYISRDKKWYYNIKDCGDMKCSPQTSRIPKTERRNVPINYLSRGYNEIKCTDEMWSKLKCKTDESSYINGKIVFITVSWMSQGKSVSFSSLEQNLYQYILFCELVPKEKQSEYTGKKIILKGGRRTGWFIQIPGGMRKRIDLRKNKYSLFDEILELCKT